MPERKSPEHDTAPETPQSRRTIAVRTGRSDPPPSLFPTPRPAAGMPADKDPTASTRTGATFPRAVAAQPAATRSAVPPWFAAALFVVVMSAIIVLALRGAR